MAFSVQSAGGGVASASAHQSGSVEPHPQGHGETSNIAPITGVLPSRRGEIALSELVDLYFSRYRGRDTTRRQRLAWWIDQLGAMRLQDISDDDIHAALSRLAQEPARCFAGHDAHGKPVHRAKAAQVSPSTVNRYCAAIGAVFTWAIHERIAPKGWAHPCRGVRRQAEGKGIVRFLSDDELLRLLQATRAAPWPRLHVLVLLAVTTGARKAELLGLRWADVDLQRQAAHVSRTKNGDARTLPLTEAVVSELRPLVGAPDALVFASTRDPRRAFAFEGQWSKALKAARIKEFRWHDLRHTCASYLAQSGATLLEIGDLLGHRQIAVTRRYSHLTVKHKAAMVHRVLGGIQ